MPFVVPSTRHSLTRSLIIKDRRKNGDRENPVFQTCPPLEVDKHLLTLFAPDSVPYSLVFSPEVFATGFHLSSHPQPMCDGRPFASLAFFAAWRGPRRPFFCGFPFSMGFLHVSFLSLTRSVIVHDANILLNGRFSLF